MRPAWSLAVLLLLATTLAGCSGDPAARPETPSSTGADAPLPDQTLFAAARHCTALDFYGEAMVPDLAARIPEGWSMPMPGVAQLRIVLWRCVDTMAMLLTVSLRAGGQTESDAPVVDYVLQVLTNSTVDDWSALGAPVTRATGSYEREGGRDIWTVVTDDSEFAVELVVAPTGDPYTRIHDTSEQYAAGDPVRWSWAREVASVTRDVEGTATFGPGSDLEGSQFLRGLPSQRWSAVNAWFYTGMVP